MKYLAYLVKKSYSWDDDDEETDYQIYFSPPEYDDYKTVVIEVVEEGSTFKNIMGR